MKPKIYKTTGGGKTIRQVSLRLVQFGICISLAAVKENGDIASNLIEFQESEAQACKSAKQALEINGYDTSFAKWDSEGKIVLN